MNYSNLEITVEPLWEGAVQVFGYAVAISITETGVASPRSRVPIRQKSRLKSCMDNSNFEITVDPLWEGACPRWQWCSYRCIY